MEQEEIELALDESNEITFDLTIEGNFKKTTNPEFRLFCEEKDFSIKLNGEKTQDGVKFVVPQLKNIISPGKHSLVFEVIADNKHFTPMKFEANFVQSNVSIKTESVSVKPKKEQATKTDITVKSNSVKKTNPEKQVKKLNEKDLRALIKETIAKR